MPGETQSVKYQCLSIVMRGEDQRRTKEGFFLLWQSTGNNLYNKLVAVKKASVAIFIHFVLCG